MIIETDGLTKIYGEKIAVNEVNISVKEGQVYGFLGQNGAGKSTFIKMLTGLVHPTKGQGQVLGKPLGDVKARERMGYLPEMFRYQDWMTGSDLIDFHTKLFRLDKNQERKTNVLKRVGLLGQEKYKVGSYSKGMQQRLGLACALLPDPLLLFLDEPTSALDPLGRKDVRDIIFSLKKEGTTVFLNSHLLSEVETVSDSITIINKGRVVKSGSVSELLMEKVTLTISLDEIKESIVNKLKENFDRRIVVNPDNKLFVTLKDKDDIPKIANFLVNEGAKIYELTPNHETLESLFLKAIEEGNNALEKGNNNATEKGNGL